MGQDLGKWGFPELIRILEKLSRFDIGRIVEPHARRSANAASVVLRNPFSAVAQTTENLSWFFDLHLAIGCQLLQGPGFAASWH